MKNLNHIAGGILMGLANLVPGISGGTMLLAAGVYRSLIEAVGELCRFNITRKSLLTIILIALPAACTIVSMAGFVSDLVTDHRPLAYATFIGLTLGGVPVLKRQIPFWTRRTRVGVVLGIAAMGGLAMLENTGGLTATSGYTMVILAGALGGASMILPGLSGGFVLLILGQYVVILNAIDGLKEGLKVGAWSAITPALQTLLPFGGGFIIGIAITALAMRMLLNKHQTTTLSVLLGLLLGAVLGLWPFRMGIPPEIGDVVRGQTIITLSQRDQVKPQNWRTEAFTPSAKEILFSLMAAGFGFCVASGVNQLAPKHQSRTQNS